jgi:hypothetical protein
MGAACATHVALLVELRLLREVAPTFARYAEQLQKTTR